MDCFSTFDLCKFIISLQTHNAYALIAPVLCTFFPQSTHRSSEGFHLFKHKTIQSNLFASYSIFIIIILLCIVLFFYDYVSGLLTETAFNTIEENCISTTQQIDAEIDQMDTMSLNISYSNLIKDEFDTYLSVKDTNSPIKSTEALNHMYNILVALIGPNLTVQQVNLYDFKSHMIGSGAKNCSLPIDVSTQSWYSDTMEKEGYKHLTLPYTHAPLFSDIRPYYNAYYISMTRIYFDNVRAQQGIVEVIQACNKVFASADSLVEGSDQSKSVYIYNESGVLVYPYKGNAPSTALNYTDYTTHGSGSHFTEVLDNPNSGKEELICYTTSKETGWTTVIVVDKAVLLKPVYSFTWLLSLFGIFIIVFSLILSYILATQITRPISRLRRLVRGMNTFENLNAQGLTELKSGLYELEELYLTFSKMSTELNQSVTEVILSHTQEAQAKFLALQSQMNPHFLYNTLANISILAEEQRTTEAVAMCNHVSMMLRYITTDQKKVMLADELAYAQEYLECMKIRYGSDLIYHIDIPIEMYNIGVPKLILQPFVENALKYGVEVDPPWKIEIIGTLEDDRWQILVRDNGNGFSTESLEKLADRIGEIDASSHLPSLSLNGMGVLNIYIRLKLFYGSDLVFKLQNNSGATVLLGGPVIPKGDSYE